VTGRLCHFADIRLDRTPAASLTDARAALAVVEEIHRQSGYPRL
jgi:hypothetical protein